MSTEYTELQPILRRSRAFSLEGKGLRKAVHDTWSGYRPMTRGFKVRYRDHQCVNQDGKHLVAPSGRQYQFLLGRVLGVAQRQQLNIEGLQLNFLMRQFRSTTMAPSETKGFALPPPQFSAPFQNKEIDGLVAAYACATGQVIINGKTIRKHRISRLDVLQEDSDSPIQHEPEIKLDHRVNAGQIAKIGVFYFVNPSQG